MITGKNIYESCDIILWGSLRRKGPKLKNKKQKTEKDKLEDQCFVFVFLQQKH